MKKLSLLCVASLLVQTSVALGGDASSRQQVQDTVSFAAGGTDLTEQFQSKLKADVPSLSALMRYRPESSVEIAGYADLGENDPGRLADDRAQKVWEFLIAQGLPAERMEPIGYGAQTDTGGRVEIRVAADDAIALTQYAQRESAAAARPRPVEPVAPAKPAAPIEPPPVRQAPVPPVMASPAPTPVAPAPPAPAKQQAQVAPTQTPVQITAPRPIEEVYAERQGFSRPASTPQEVSAPSAPVPAELPQPTSPHADSYAMNTEPVAPRESAPSQDELQSTKGRKIRDNQLSSTYTRPLRGPLPKSALPGEGSYFIQDTAFFLPNGRELTPDSTSALDSIAHRLERLIKSRPNLQVDVVGHSDPLSESGQADVLAEARAEELAKALAARGVDRSHLRPAGAADRQPLITKKGDKQHELNSRAEIRVPN